MEGSLTRAVHPQVPGMVGQSAEIRQVVTNLEAVARVRRTTLITGPTGTGKEIVARALHERGQPASAPFVVVHCGGLPDTLAEDELFGHTRGAFTGARDTRGGLVRSARGGTLFLDEVDSLSPKVQASLLRFLESGEFR
ncbi:MAG TPA: sigma 54-interacting transcriptional regulator, partial [Longimicrobiaceae bacterium]|nr:sigma 54-interacting transcriptional regulator [Longimicrobiaceae bacterium]